MTKKLFLAALVLALVLPPFPRTVQAQDLFVCGQNPSQLVAGDHEQITVSSTALGLTAAKLNPTTGAPRPTCAVIQVISTVSISYWGAFGVPTASDGQLLPQYGSITVGPSNLTSVRMIRVTTDATVSVQYFSPATQ